MKYIVISSILNCTLYSHLHVHVYVFFGEEDFIENQQTQLQSVGEKDKRLWLSKRRENKK